MSDEVDVLGVQHVHTARTRVVRLVVPQDNRHQTRQERLEHVLEARVRHVGVGVTDVAVSSASYAS